jgi:pimeloyl-ACP methyl ester carboxylesterase
LAGVSGSPLFRGLERIDLIWAAASAQAQITDDSLSLRRLCEAVAPGTFKLFPGDLLTPDCATYEMADDAIVCIKGTDTIFQWISHFLISGSFQLPSPGVRILAYFYLTALTIRDAIDSTVQPWLSGKRIAFVGHSFGAAIAQILAYQYMPLAIRRGQVTALGSPRVGSVAFSDAVSPFTFRLEANSDPIPALPPILWAGPGSIFPVPGPGIPTDYKHAGTAQTLQADSDLVDGSQIMSLPEVVAAFVAGDVNNHHAKYYLSTLIDGVDLDAMQPGDDGFQNPANLAAVVNQMLGIFPPVKLPATGVNFMAGQLVQGVQFFRDKNVSEGWGEAIFATVDIPTMQGYLDTLSSLRAAFLSSECEMHADRVSNVGGPKLSTVRRYSTPVAGAQLEATNEVGDCFLYKFHGPLHTRILTFRGVPDSGIAGSLPGPSAATLKLQMESYISQMIALGIQLKIPDPANTVLTCSSLANTVAGGPILVTTDIAHLLDTGDLIQLNKLRGFPYLRGRWKISVLSATTFTLVGSQRYNINVTGQGTVQKITYIGETAANKSFKIVSFRQTGRPFGSSRGRSAAKVLHH